MSNKTLAIGVLAIVAAAGLYWGFSGGGAVLGASDSKALEVRWLLSHQPTDVFERAAGVFKAELEKASAGSMTLRVITPEEVGVPKGDIPNAEVFKFLNDGTADIATAYTVALGKTSPDLWAVNLPFLFADHAAVGAALDGAMGAAVMKSLPQGQGVVGLAFTMSGGYRIIVSKNTKISSVADLKGKRIATSGGPVAQETLSALGAIPVPTDLESANAQLDAATIDGVEITYSRLNELTEKSQYTKYVNETNHSVFLTAILADQDFYATLTPDQQSALTKAALAAAAVEREDSKALGDKVRADLSAEGSTITTLSADAAAEFAAKTRSVYEKFLPTFSESVRSLIAQ